MQPYKRRKYFIDKRLQTKYALLTLLLLIVYSGIFVLIVFLPYIIPLEHGSSAQEQLVAARVLLELHNSVWPAVGVLIVVMSILSIFITHKIAGPVYRLKQALSEVSAGNLGVTVQLRKHDDLQDLAADMNMVTEELRDFVAVLKNDHQAMSECIWQLEQQLSSKSIDDTTGRELIGRMRTSRDSIARTLDKYLVR